MKNWAHTLFSGLLMAGAYASHAVQAVAVAHPVPMIASLLVWAVAGHLLPTPVPGLWKRLGE